MKIKNDQAGLTLVELLVTIAVGSVVMLAACTMLLFGLRINNQSTKNTMGQNTVQVLMEALEDVAAEAQNLVVKDDGSAWILSDGETGKVYYSYFQNVVYTGEFETPFLKNVFSSSVSCKDKLLTIHVQMENANYETSIYCRLLKTDNVKIETDSDILIDFLNGKREDSGGIEINVNESQKEFLQILAGEYGSHGEIINPMTNQEGNYYSEWYIGGYKENSSWNKDTPWCACFVSWAMAKSNNISMPKKQANVEKLRNEFSAAEWKVPTTKPNPGDLIFFNFDEDAEADHVGVVLTVSGNYIYTIEGNTMGKVSTRKYLAYFNSYSVDSHILGYVKVLN